MENTQTKAKASKQLVKPISFYHKYNCETCKYHTNLKNSFNKHIKSSKHLTLNLVEEKTESDTNVVEEKQQDDRQTTSDHLQPEVEMGSSMEFISVEETETDAKNDNTFQCSECQLTKIVDLVEGLNTSFNDDLRIKYFCTGMGFFFHFILFNLFLFHLFVRSQRSDFFELSG